MISYWHAGRAAPQTFNIFGPGIICGISLRDHVPSVVILNRCSTLSVESQLQGKRLRWLGHVFRMPNDRLPKKLLFGEVKGLRSPGRPRSSFNDVALRDC